MKLSTIKDHAMIRLDQDTSPRSSKALAPRRPKKEAQQKTYVDIVKDFKEECIPTKEKAQGQSMQNQQSTEKRSQEEGLWRTIPQRRSPPKYQTIFLGICYSCNNFGHKVVNCKAYARNGGNSGNCSRNAYSRRSWEDYKESYNLFGYLRNEEECYK